MKPPHPPPCARPRPRSLPAHAWARPPPGGAPWRRPISARQRTRGEDILGPERHRRSIRLATTIDPARRFLAARKATPTIRTIPGGMHLCAGDAATRKAMQSRQLAQFRATQSDLSSAGGTASSHCASSSTLVGRPAPARCMSAMHDGGGKPVHLPLLRRNDGICMKSGTSC